MNPRHFLSLLPLASGLVLPKPRRVYSFLWNCETEYEHAMRHARAVIRASFERHVGAPLNWDAPFSASGAVESAILRGGGLIYPWRGGFGVEVTPNAYLLTRPGGVTARIEIVS